MLFTFVAMNAIYTRKMIDEWQYSGEYSIYDYINEAEHLLDQAIWGNGLFAVLDEKKNLVGEVTIEFFTSNNEYINNEQVLHYKEQYPDNTGLAANDNEGFLDNTWLVVNDKEAFTDNTRLVANAEEQFQPGSEQFVNSFPLELTMGIGFGLRPDLTGQGLGEEFVTACLNFAKIYYNFKGKIMLGVAAFNQRAKKVYERVGFKPIETIQAGIGDKKFEIIRMELIS